MRWVWWFEVGVVDITSTHLFIHPPIHPSTNSSTHSSIHHLLIQSSTHQSIHVTHHPTHPPIPNPPIHPQTYPGVGHRDLLYEGFDAVVVFANLLQRFIDTHDDFQALNKWVVGWGFVMVGFCVVVGMEICGVLGGGWDLWFWR